MILPGALTFASTREHIDWLAKYECAIAADLKQVQDALAAARILAYSEVRYQYQPCNRFTPMSCSCDMCQKSAISSNKFISASILSGSRLHGAT